MKRRFAIALIGAALSAGLPMYSAAQAYPSKTVTLVVPYAAGGATDTVARLYADALRKEAQQTFIVENKPGANGLIAMEYVSRAPKDGTVILVGNPATNALLPVTGKAKFDIEKAFLPVARLATVPGVLVAARKLSAKNVKELVDYARKNPGKVSYASAGNGSLAHLNFLALEEQAGIDMIHVPYKGGPQALTDNLAGLVDLNFLNLSSALPLVKDGKLTALAVSGDSRLEQLPAVATMPEQGFQDSSGGNWQGLFLPAGTPPAIVDRLVVLASKASENPELRAQLKAASMMLDPTASPADFKKFLDTESGSFRRLIQKHNIIIE
ncbi:tripartite tricarboxylate transporter substrate binding protein [Variovorax sp. J22P271]|uniref:Bug family tripartite tricarboxylate transporter substrate binding protein n=1 Tax=Variovorax davisae TaxID=3053515 RepID=UPI0025776F60|nr:tripartite tricarboxylate transporter substrate binding protein [Variovorax sp. J22P271]MDM0037302.1 tripartite tricarboxylate transporter substrate binding protein [Variovorax sp. J22P271]